MSLNWKEINLILKELDLAGAQIQDAVQSTFDVIVLRVHKAGETKRIMLSLSSGACRIHEMSAASVKTDKPLRFAQFLKSRVVNGWITEAVQLGEDRIVRLIVKRGEWTFKLYIRLWSNAANFIVTDENGVIMDAMRRLPKRDEITGGQYMPENIINSKKPVREYEIRELSGEGSFNKRIDRFYAEKGGPLSLEALKEQARNNYEGSIARIKAALEKLMEKEKEFSNAERLKFYGDVILTNISKIKYGDKWLDADNLRIELHPGINPAAQAAKYFEKYKKAKKGLREIQEEISEGENKLNDLKLKLERLLAETNPLILSKLLKSFEHTGSRSALQGSKNKGKTRPGLTFRRGDWLILVGRDASENDELLRRHVKGNDLWLHARDYHGSYVFIKQRSGKTVPLDILLDAGNLAVFYSKGRNNAEGDLFYTSVKYLRRAKNGAKGKAPKGLVIPTQEKNLHIKIDETRLRSLKNSQLF